MTDRTAAALASALPALISYETAPDGAGMTWRAEQIAAFQANVLAESGWRLVHADDHPLSHVRVREDPGLVLDPDGVHDHVEVGDE